MNHLKSETELAHQDPIVLTGTKSTGFLHIGNYFGAMKQALELHSKKKYIFIADLHSLNVIPDPKIQLDWTYDAVATWLALGINTDEVVFWRQSDVPEVIELMWYLSPFTPYGLLTRAHSFKDAQAKQKDINAGLFNYPLLMSADILLYRASQIPVGKDQKQHVEIARDIAIRFNNQYGSILTIPEPVIKEEVAIIPGIDGNKMSKSLNNTLPLSLDRKSLRKLIMKIVTDSKELNDIKDPEHCNIVNLYKLMASQDEVNTMKQKYLSGGYGYGHAKQELYERMTAYFERFYNDYCKIINDRGYMNEILAKGANKARLEASILIDQVRRQVGTK